MALTNIREFRLAIDAHNKRTHERRRLMTKAVAMRALEGVVLGTRVDTGRARGNWQVTEGAPADGYDPDLGAVGGRTGDDAPTMRVDPIAEGSAKIEGASGDDTIWLHNGVPYIVFLEERDKMVAGNVEALRTWLMSQ